MARLVQVIVEEPRPCSYLENRSASLEHRILLEATADELDAMLVRGWRRFGPDYFRPACAPCSDCVPTRIPTATFAPTKSQRRARRKCADLRAVVGPPRVDDARLELYRRWHAERERTRDWEPAAVDAKTYFIHFAFPHPAAREIAYWDDDAPGGPALVGVGLCDETKRAWSAIYFYYDPEWGKRSLGIANVVFQVELARERNIPQVYLGYRIAECRSMAYKAGFHPQERLVGWPSPEEEPSWVPAT